MKLTPEQKKQRRLERAEYKRIEDLALQQQAEAIARRINERGERASNKQPPPRDSAGRGALAYNAWQRGQRTGQRFRCQGR